MNDKVGLKVCERIMSPSLHFLRVSSFRIIIVNVKVGLEKEKEKEKGKGRIREEWGDDCIH